MPEKLSYEEFVRRAIESLRAEGYKGIHSVYSGFNDTFRRYFNGADPVNITNQLAAEGKNSYKICQRWGNALSSEDAPRSQIRGDEALEKMGLK